jgi:hypothetical protein
VAQVANLDSAAPTARLTDVVLRTIARFWDRKPGLFRGAAAEISTTEHFLMSLCGISHAMRSAAFEPAWRAPVALFIEETSDEEGFEASLVLKPWGYLPSEGESLKAYVERLEQRFAPRRFCLQIRGMERDWSIWSDFSPLTRRLRDVLSIRDRRMDVVGYLGNYSRTPFGIHKDSQHVLTFVVAGQKRMLLWPFKTFGGRPEVPKDARLKQAGIFALKNEFAHKKRGAVVLDGRAGDVMYWPPSYWHCADASPGVAITLTLGVEEDADGRRRFRQGPAAAPKDTSDARPRSILERRLEAVTGCGLASRPDSAPLRELDGGEYVTLAGPWTIQLSRLSQRTYVAAAHGYSTTISASLSRVIGALNTRSVFRVDSLLDGVDRREGAARRRQAAGLLSLLCSWHAVRVIR